MARTLTQDEIAAIAPTLTGLPFLSLFGALEKLGLDPASRAALDRAVMALESPSVPSRRPVESEEAAAVARMTRLEKAAAAGDHEAETAILTQRALDEHLAYVRRGGPAGAARVYAAAEAQMDDDE